MVLVLEFAKIFFIGLLYAAPVLIALVVVIAVLGYLVGKNEGWSRSDALYYAFITATTVGYGDFHPKRKVSKMLAVAIALVGIMFTGLVVGVGLHASLYAFQMTHEASHVLERIKQGVPEK